MNPITSILSTGKPGVRPEKRYVVESGHEGTIVFQTWERPAAKRYFMARRCSVREPMFVIDALRHCELASAIPTPNGVRIQSTEL